MASTFFRGARAACGLTIVLGLAVALAVGAPTAAAAAQQDAAEDTNRAPAQVIALTDAMVLAPVGQYGRQALHEDALWQLIVEGRWAPPVAGDSVTLADGTERPWQPARAEDSGWLQKNALRGGYAHFTVDMPHERVMLLEARGHSSVRVNGVQRAGDVYDTGMTRLPVHLRAGANSLLFHVRRGRMKAQLVEPAARALLHMGDSTLPDLVIGEDEDVSAAVIVLNMATTPLRGALVHVDDDRGGRTTTSLPDVPALGMRKVGLRVAAPAWDDADAAPEDGSVRLALTLAEPTGAGAEIVHDTADLALRCVEPTDLHKRTFVSGIDGSVQLYAVRPAVPADGTDEAGSAAPALVLSCHGAGVPARRQASCYRPREWCHVVAPTNRRPYGFDWEDWGRLDAMEVLELAAQRYGTDPRRTYVTGHSMGGHGTWHLGLTYPDRFAAMAPSAGWVSFWSYTGAERYEDATPLESMLLRAVASSDTLALQRNASQMGVFILHGDRDDNVPVEQARIMRRELAGFHANFAYYERPGAGHWWGNQCMDWPPLFDFLRLNELPAAGSVRRVEFATAGPGVSASCHWASIGGQLADGMTSRVAIDVDPGRRRFAGTTENVRRLALDASAVLEPGSPLEIELDGQALIDVAWPATGTLHAQRDAASGTWTVAGPLDPALKGPHRYGPFKDAFRRRMVFVYGTTGSEEERRWSYAKARYDAETFWYRGNGSVDLVADVDLDLAALGDRNVIVYGNADTNAAWSELLGASPVQVRRGRVTVGDRELSGDDLAALFIQPRRDSDVASVGVVAGTGMAGLRMTERLPYFVSGIGYPDLIVLTPRSLTDGIDGVLAAGFFGPDWSVREGEIVFAEP